MFLFKTKYLQAALQAVKKNCIGRTLNISIHLNIKEPEIISHFSKSNIVYIQI